jgi:hypothetical protein
MDELMMNAEVERQESVPEIETDIAVPGLFQAIQQLRSAYPALSYGAIRRILGMPTLVAIHTVGKLEEEE